MWGKQDSTGKESEMCGREREENNIQKGNEKQVRYEMRKWKKRGRERMWDKENKKLKERIGKIGMYERKTKGKERKYV